MNSIFEQLDFIMCRVFAYSRVSTNDQTVENQILEIKAAGFDIEPHRMITETISGSTPMQNRFGFRRLLDKMEAGDILVVTKLDRLGRNSLDVTGTVLKLQDIGIKVHCIALGGVDLTSPAGKMTMNVLNAVAEFERDLLIERTNAGLARAKSQGKELGRPKSLNPAQKLQIAKQYEDGTSIASLANIYDVSRATVMRAIGRL